MLISDRDGVLFDTCRANFQSYVASAQKFGIKTDFEALANAIHQGRSFQSFYLEVWGELSEKELKLMSSEKKSLFKESSSLVKVNSNFIELTLIGEKNPYLVTRASLPSTLYLLEVFQIGIFEHRVVSVPSGESKSARFGEIAKSLNLLPSEILVIDDSLDVAKESSLLGFNTIHYPHFCDF